MVMLGDQVDTSRTISRTRTRTSSRTRTINKFTNVASDFVATYNKATSGRLEAMLRGFREASSTTAVVVPNGNNTVSITEGHYAGLLDEKYLSESVINAYINICESKIKHKETDFLILRSESWTMWDMMVDRGNISPRAAGQLAQQVHKYKMVIIPVIHDIHWTLVVISNNAFYYYDAMGPTSRGDVEIIQQVLAQAPEGATFADWPTFTPRCCMQKNNYDCGVFVAQWIRTIAQGKSTGDVVQKRMRAFRYHMVEELFCFATAECLEQY